MPVSDSTLQLLIGTYVGQNTIHAKDVLAALRELQERRATVQQSEPSGSIPPGK